ncbi:MAG: hypothetical protein D3913_08465 [Candidatus Electrothrix sp. LOE1_4_5]|nr:hypothetical protein [Candidatus Electrothrix gigas]
MWEGENDMKPFAKWTVPIYGAYIIERHWYFVVLDGKVYSESLAYDATKDEIMEIFGMLRHTKEIIRQLVSARS